MSHQMKCYMESLRKSSEAVRDCGMIERIKSRFLNKRIEAIKLNYNLVGSLQRYN